MKRRLIVIFLVLLTTVLCGTAFASVNGMFEGFPIVNIEINGKKVTGDTPAINFNGRTMVPVRFVSENLGAQVGWDGNTQTVSITSSDTYNDASYHLANIKDLVFILDHYSDLKEFNYQLNNTFNMVHSSFHSINDDNDKSRYYTTKEHIENQKSSYSSLNNKNDNVLRVAEEKNIQTDNLKKLISNTNLVINYLENALDDLNSFSYSKNDQNFYKMYNNLDKAGSLIIENIDLAMKSYDNMYLKIQIYFP